MRTIGLLHPGAMGAPVGGALRSRGLTILWASAGRSTETSERAEAAGLEDAGSVEELARRSDVVLSICPPHAAVEVARPFRGFDGLFVDANAVSPATVCEVETEVGGRFVDGGIVGGPPGPDSRPRLYLSGQDAATVADLFAGTQVDARVVSSRVGDASALKMVYAAWSKGAAAMLLAIRETARAHGVEDALLTEWSESLPDLPARSERSARSADAKAWRWAGEMEEIAATFEAAGLPGGFHHAAAEVFRRWPNLGAPAE